jgi:amino acid adenylation domain-containing protein
VTDLAVGRGLVQRWRAGPGDTAPAPPGPAPISTAQRGILIFERLRPGTAVFNLCYAVRHAGCLDEDRLDLALSALLRRHPALRATFIEGDAGPVRIISDDVAVATRWADLRHLPESQRWTAALERAACASAEPFDLASGPLVRVHGYRVADDERLLVFVAHHLVCDGGSMRFLLGELDPAYRAELDGVVPSPVPAPADPAALEHWRTRLAGLPRLDLPAKRGHPSQPTFRGGSVPIAMPADLVAAAERLARDEKTTLFTVVLAAFQVLLGQHTGQSDFAVGCPEAGRSRPGYHGAVGLLSDLLVLRADLSGRPSFREVVRRARATCLEAMAHRGVPFEDLVAALEPGRHLDSPLVQAGIAFQGDWGDPTLAGSPLEQVVLPRPALRYDLDLHLWRSGGGLRGTWDYGADTFDQATATRMAQRLPAVLGRGLADPDTPLGQVDLLAGEERALLDEWGRGPTPETPDVSLVDLFAAQVARTPEAVAIEDPRRRLTYRQLNERANQLAHLLHGRNVEPGDIVGIRLGRTADLAVAMLGIMKAGAAYLPLDPAYPAERTDYMVRDSSARTVVTETELDALEHQPISDPDAGPVPPDSLAYVLYTSGSTGRPKGALITHRNAVPVALWGAQAFTAGQMSRVLASTSICFDVSVFEFFGTLCTGGTVVVVDNALALLADPPVVTMICAVPSAARALVEARALPPSTRVVCLGGEAVTRTLVDDLYATGHVEAVVNCYGPTEDTTYSTFAVLQPEEQPPPIGALLPHGRGYVLDGDLRPVPVGAVGELYLAGRGLSQGYVNRGALTASRYVADPQAPVPGDRMYRTGDVVLYRSDGALLYLGRRDFQVKVRGQRIELGEIETVLQGHPDVADAVVRLYDGRLVGYVTARGPGDPDLDGIRAHLRRTLPVVMIPSSLVLLPELPQTPNGKVDRLALPAPDAPVALGGDPPRGADEELVARVWRDVLGLDTVGRDDDFFDLGGDSLLAGDVLNRLRERAGQGLPLRLVFENSRLADLAAVLPAHGASLIGDTVPPRPPDAPPVLSFEQQRTWLECQLRAGTAYNVHGRQWLRGPLDVAVLERSIRSIIERHEVLRTVFPIAGGLPEQRVTEPDPCWRIAVEDRSGPESGGEAAAERLADAQAAMSFDLARGPLFRCLLIRLSDTSHLLCLTVHHIVSDGRSVGLILRELSALYQAGGVAEQAGLPRLPVQYRDYAVHQRTALTEESLAAPIGYWRDRLSGAPPALALPTARRRLPSQTNAGGKVRATLGVDEAAALQKLCRVHGVTPFMAMLAALATVLRRWSGQEDLVIGVPVDTRRAAGTEVLVGLFVNTVPLRIDLSGNPAFSELLSRVRQTAVGGYVTYGDTPFDVLVGKLRPVRDPARTPLFQVLLNMIEDADDEWRLPGIVTETPGLPAQPSKFDLNLDVHPHGDCYWLDLLYNAERFESSAMRTLLGQLAAVLAAACEDPSRSVLELELQGPAEEDISAPGQGAPSSAEACDLGAGDRVAIVGEHAGLLSFVRSAGAAALLPDEATTSDPDALVTWLRNCGATAVFLPAPLLRSLEPDRAGIASPLLRLVLLDNRGDLTAHDVGRARRLAPGCRVVALYRPAAGAAPVAGYAVPDAWSPSSAPLRVPAGTELSGRLAALRNPAGRPAAIGEVGHLWVDGVRTAELVRRRPDHVLELADPGAASSPSEPGRWPGDTLETVAVLRDLPDVQDAIVTAGPDSAGRPVLIAYLASQGRTVDLRRLRQRLVTHLPEYLIPRHIVPMGRLPLTAAGDYDIAALPPAGDEVPE